MPKRTFSTVSSVLFLAVLEASFNLPDTSDMGGLDRVELTGNPKFADSGAVLTVRVSSCQHAEGRFGSPQSPRILREASPGATTRPACSAGWGGRFCGCLGNNLRRAGLRRVHNLWMYVNSIVSLVAPRLHRSSRL